MPVSMVRTQPDAYFFRVFLKSGSPDESGTRTGGPCPRARIPFYLIAFASSAPQALARSSSPSFMGPYEVATRKRCFLAIGL